MEKQWNIMDQDDGLVRSIEDKFGTDTLVARLLVNRGLTEFDEIEQFLQASLNFVHSPFAFSQMEKAVSRVQRAIQDGEQILVYGDYDVDGITSVSIMVLYLRSRGARVTYYIPSRFTEGYGLNSQAVEQFAREGVKLVITVDCGVTAVEQVGLAKELGIDVIVTDHHEPKERLPDCVALINPKVTSGGYPFKELAGVGVAFKLICALEPEKKAAKLFFQYSELVAIGTVADLMSITKENRIIVKFGLDMLNCGSNNNGVKALLRMLNFEKQVTASTISYYIAPKINAVGKLGNASRAVELFIAQDMETADSLAAVLFEENKLRQEMESEILAEATGILAQTQFADGQVIVLSRRGWHSGLLGSIASRICEQYQKSCILISIDEQGTGKGSCRSYGKFHILKALEHCSDLLEAFGGHEFAAGFTIAEDKVDLFSDRINGYTQECSEQEESLELDCELDENLLSIESVKALSVLRPYGTGNPAPLFALMHVRLTEINALAEKHSRLTFTKHGKVHTAILFGKAPKELGLKTGDIVCLAVNIEINLFRGLESVQVLIRDYKKSREKDIVLDGQEEYSKLRQSGIIPKAYMMTKNELSGIYRYVGKNGTPSAYSTRFSEMIFGIGRQFGIETGYIGLRFSLDVMRELGILEYIADKDHISITMGEYKKVDLSQSPLWQRLCRDLKG